MPELVVHPRQIHKSLPVKWEVVLYRIPRYIGPCYGHVFDLKREAELYASLEMANPNWSQVVVHCVHAHLCGR